MIGEGTAYVIDQLGVALRAANVRIGELTAENARLREQLELHNADGRRETPASG